MVRSHKRPGVELDVEDARGARRVKLTARSPGRETMSLCLLGADEIGFRGRRLHGVQIGLGTFCTIPENLAGKWHQKDKNLGWLLRSTSEKRPDQFRAVVVEPVPEHLDRVRKLATKLPQMRFAQAAVSDEEAKSIELHVVTQNSNDAMVKSVPRSIQRSLEAELVYLRNMSSVGGKHPFIETTREKIWKKYKVDVLDGVRTIHTGVWSYAKLAKQYDFCGCELLVIDAEGHDTKIIRSMIAHCKEQESHGKMSWPDVIAFETCGICDKTEGVGSEIATIQELENLGYAVFMKHWMNTHLVRKEAATSSSSLKRWLEEIPCEICKKAKHWPMTMNPGYSVTCEKCAASNTTSRPWSRPDVN